MVDYDMLIKIMKYVDISASGIQIILGIAKYCGIMNSLNSLDGIVNFYLM